MILSCRSRSRGGSQREVSGECASRLARQRACALSPAPHGGAAVGSLQDGEVVGGGPAPLDQEEGCVVAGAPAPLLFQGVGE